MTYHPQNVMARLDRAIAVSLVMMPMARASRAMTHWRPERQTFGRLALDHKFHCFVLFLTMPASEFERARRSDLRLWQIRGSVPACYRHQRRHVRVAAPVECHKAGGRPFGDRRIDRETRDAGETSHRPGKRRPRSVPPLLMSNSGRLRQ